MADKISTKDLQVDFKVRPDLPSVSVDRQRINHVFTNLISNAVKYSSPDGENCSECHAGRGQWDRDEGR